MFPLGVCARRANGFAVVTGSAAGMLAVVLVMAMPEISWPWYCGSGTLVTFVAGSLGSLFSSVPESQENVSHHLVRKSVGKSRGIA